MLYSTPLINTNTVCVSVHAYVNPNAQHHGIAHINPNIEHPVYTPPVNVNPLLLWYTPR